MIGGAARLTRGARREDLLSLQAPIGLFAQLATWIVLVGLGFAAILWSVEPTVPGLGGLTAAMRLSGSSLTTLGVEHATSTAGTLTSFTEA
ncbi:MAG: hypothetical protein JOZ49_05555, partial [Mycolicibacterium sp.]|nr:hypothetical protein [Mycolicibacterium sp.]